MSTQYLTRVEEPQVPPYHAADMAQGLYAALARFLAPLLIELDARIDKRLVRTDLANRGGDPDVSRSRQWIAAEPNWEGISIRRTKPLLAPSVSRTGSHCVKWSADLIRQFLWQRATQQVKAWNDAGQDAASHLG